MESDPKETRKEELNSWLQLIGAREWDEMWWWWCVGVGIGEITIG